MNSTATYKTIKQTVELCLPGCRIVLFGSRAKGNEDGLSDYDLLIITPTTFTPHEKLRWSTLRDRALVEAIKAPIDLLLNSEEEVSQKQILPGNVIRTAMREGIRL